MSCSIKRPGLNFSQKSLLINWGYLKKIENVSIKRPGLSQVSNYESIKLPGVTIETVE